MCPYLQYVHANFEKILWHELRKASRKTDWANQVIDLPQGEQSHNDFKKLFDEYLGRNGGYKRGFYYPTIVKYLKVFKYYYENGSKSQFMI